MVRILLFSLLVIQAGFCFGQDVAQTVRGQITDITSGTPLPGATVQLMGDESYGTISEQDGTFRLDNVRFGRYRIEISFVGYESFSLAEVNVNAGKETIINISLREVSQELQEVVIRGVDELNTKDFISARTITAEETQRFAASFYDPARLVASFPGVVTANDQGNNIAVRGNSPNSLRWWLEGVEIVNPNHTSNAGTLSDKPTQNGGGVNMLSAQLLDNSQFITGGFTPGYTNVQSSLLDMQLRDGNDQEHEYIAQASLLGLEFAAEGPFKQNSQSSYLVNYRYSTVGLLSAFGIDFGGESITFQDLSFNLSFPIKNGQIKLFGVGGLSKNTFLGEPDSTNWTDDKSRQDIRFSSGMATAGLRIDKSLGSRSSFYTTIAWSGVNSKRQADLLQTGSSPSKIQDYESTESKSSLHSGVLTRIGQSNELNVGLHVVNHEFEISDSDRGTTFADDKAKNLRLAPYANLRINFSQALNLNLGAQAHYSGLSKETVAEPRVSLKWRVSGANVFRVSYTRAGQSASSYALLTGGGLNKDLNMIKSDQYILGYYTFLGKTRLSLEGYYQRIFDAPIEANGVSYSVLNDLTTSKPVVMTNDGTGVNYGADVSIERFFQNNYYIIAGGSWYKSEYEAADGLTRPTRFDGRYTFNISTGKEWTKDAKNRVIGVNARVFYLGGLRDTPVDENASRQAGTTVFQEDAAFSLSNNNYFRVDLRLSTTKHKPGYTRIIALDIQNASGIENDAYLYFDQVQDKTVTATQLGIIPVVSYRVEF